MLKIAIIISTTRQTRFADKPASWLMNLAQKRSDMKFELLDLRDFPMPFFDEVASNAYAPSKNETAQRWQKKVAGFDGYVFLVAEYNRTIPAALKNALDYAYPEWIKKPAAFVGYGSVGAARAIEHLRLICVELQMAPMRNGVHIQGGDFMAVWQQGKKMEELTYLEPGVKDMLDQLAWWGTTLKGPREAK
ncbi:MAG: NAD(P)H-dependent oxidoreductase [Cytophagaceae bacterium]|nr:MAG: NAD(P)H-dependent oxidoreductase [Cytophagaceae bacterium]